MATAEDGICKCGSILHDGSCYEYNHDHIVDAVRHGVRLILGNNVSSEDIRRSTNTILRKLGVRTQP